LVGGGCPGQIFTLTQTLSHKGRGKNKEVLVGEERIESSQCMKKGA